METSQIAKSFAGLVATNGGKFKSEKQAGFLLSQITNNNDGFIASGSFWNSSFTNTYLCDDLGVVSVTHWTPKTGDIITWTRPAVGQVSPQQIKEIKRLTRMYKMTELSMLKRQEAFDAGKYPDVEMFESCQVEDSVNLSEIQSKINQLS